MRGIVLADVRRVQLVTASHPAITSFQRWLAQRITTNLETKFHERQQERDRLASLLGAPFDVLLTQEAMVEQYMKHVYKAPPLPQLPSPTCHDCRHCAVDRYTPGGFVCWDGYAPGARPRRLTTFAVCQGFADRRPQPQPPSWYEIKREMDAYLAVHGIRYHAGRWKAHQYDLERQAGTWGFQVGRAWEADVRGWFQEHYGVGFFVPHRWLIVTDCHGCTHYREVDGLERTDDTHAFVYEFKHQSPGYVQLAQEYLPLLRLAYPTRVFTPVEINAADPYVSMSALTAPKIRVIPSLEARKPDGQYQLFVLSMSPGHAPVVGSTAPTSTVRDADCVQREQEQSHA